MLLINFWLQACCQCPRTKVDSWSPNSTDIYLFPLPAMSTDKYQRHSRVICYIGRRLQTFLWPICTNFTTTDFILLEMNIHMYSNILDLCKDTWYTSRLDSIAVSLFTKTAATAPESGCRIFKGHYNIQYRVYRYQWRYGWTGCFLYISSPTYVNQLLDIFL